MDANGFHSSVFKYPFEGESVASAKHQLGKFRAVEWCDPFAPKQLHHCNLVNCMEWLTKPPRKSRGLELADF